MIRDLGADEVVGSGEELKAIGGADVILSTSSSYRSASEALNGLRPDGRLVLIGMSNEPLEVTSQLMRTRGRIIGSLQNGNEYLYEALDYVARGKVRIISETYPLNEVGKAYERLAEGQVRYRAVLTF